MCNGEAVRGQGNRSRKQPPARKLLHRLQVGKLQALAFLYNFAVPFENASVERYHRTYGQECLQVYQPSTLKEVTRP